MKEAHILNLPTSATMMYGHVETIGERIDHLIKLREIQDIKPKDHYGFITFIPWPFQDEGTVLLKKHGVKSNYTGSGYLRMISISRILLDNIPNIQSSWITQGPDIAQLALFFGANDLGSIMIEENVVYEAGARYRISLEEIVHLITEAGFIPHERNFWYHLVD